MATEIKLFARKCDCCGKGMNEGYVIDCGGSYFCSDECLDKSADTNTGEVNGVPTTAELIVMHEEEEDCDSYWTEWEEEDDYQYQEIDGVLTEIEEE